MERIKLSAVPSQVFRAVLGGQDCTMTLYQRGDNMYLDLYKDVTPIIFGAVCRDRVNIIQRATPDFSGILFFADTLGGFDPDWRGLDSRFILVYAATGEELPAGVNL